MLFYKCLLRLSFVERVRRFLSAVLCTVCDLGDSSWPIVSIVVREDKLKNVEKRKKEVGGIHSAKRHFVQGDINWTGAEAIEAIAVTNWEFDLFWMCLIGLLIRQKLSQIWIAETRTLTLSVPPRNHVFLNGPTPATFSFIFVFSNTHYNFYTKCIWKKCPSSKHCRDSNSWPLEHESPPITTRPGHPHSQPIHLIHFIAFSRPLPEKFFFPFRCSSWLPLGRLWSNLFYL